MNFTKKKGQLNNRRRNGFLPIELSTIDGYQLDSTLKALI